MPAVFSLLTMSIHAFERVKPWRLCIVIAQANFKDSFCLSCTPLNVLKVTVIGYIGTQCGMPLIIDGSVEGLNVISLQCNRLTPSVHCCYGGHPH